MKVAIVGCGNMGTAYARSLKGIENEKVAVSLYDNDSSKLEILEQEGLGKAYPEVGVEFGAHDVVIMAVKPQSFSGLAKELKKHMNAAQLLISIMAGVKITIIQEALGVQKVVRAMPNTPCQLGLGATGYYFKGISDNEERWVNMLLGSTGVAVAVQNEDLVDAVTALSGSGPAYFYLFLYSLVEAGLQMGLPRETSELLALNTMKGAHALMGNSPDFETLIAAVKSKGGTTEAALNVMQEKELPAIVGAALSAAKSRALELSNMIEI